MAFNVSCYFLKFLILKRLIFFFVKLCYNVIKKPTILLEISKIAPLISRRTTKTLDIVKSQLNI